MNTEERYSGIHHAAFATSNLPATVHFWRDLLGFRLCLDVGSGDERQIFFGIGPVAFISFFVWVQAKAMPRKTHGRPVRGSFNFDHISIGVRRRRDLVRLQSILEESEYPVSDVIDHGFIHSIYTFDPNGIGVEFSLPVEDRDIFTRPFSVMIETATDGPGEKKHWNEIKPESAADDAGLDEEPYFTIPGAGSDLFGDDDL